MRRVIIILVVIAVVAAVGWYGYEHYVAGQAEEEAAAAAADVAAAELDNVIWASGKLLPATWAELSPVDQGVVAHIHVEEGEWVQAGALLIELENGVLNSQLDAAQAGLVEAKAALDQVLAEAADADIAAAQAALNEAEAGVSQAAGRMIEIQSAIKAAETQVEMARRQYRELASHPTAAEQNAAKAEVAIAEANVRTAQAAYNIVKGDPNVGAMPQSQALAGATAALEAAKALQAVTASGPTPQQLAVAASVIDAAEVLVESAQTSAPAAEANVQAAIAGRASAQAAFDKLLAGATEEEIAIAAAKVASAEAAVNTAKAQLALSQVTAPFAGEIGEINVRLGEPTVAGEAAVLLGDTAQMVVETTDLRETDVVYLEEGMPVEVTFDALPDVIFDGVIARIASVSNTEKGGTNYTVEINVDDLADQLRWGMTAFVNIQVER